MKNIIWITWEVQLRNKSLSHRLGAKLYQLNSEGGRLKRYLKLTWQTFSIIKNSKEKNVIVQNPSIILALSANLFCRLFSKSLVVDAHNGGIHPLDGMSKILNMIALFVIKVTPLTIVTNQALVDYVHKKGGRSVIVPDPLPELPNLNIPPNKKATIMFICTWALDEPFEEVIEAANQLSIDCTIYITGKYQKILDSKRVKNLPDNIKLTGFLSEYNYNKLLNEVDVTLDLTTRENCLVCGAYESVAVGTPMILSDTQALRDYFYKGALYTNNTARDIAYKIEKIISNHEIYLNDIKHLKNEIDSNWDQYKVALLSKMVS